MHALHGCLFGLQVQVVFPGAVQQRGVQTHGQAVLPFIHMGTGLCNFWKKCSLTSGPQGGEMEKE